jgi:hypothetical protein
LAFAFDSRVVGGVNPWIKVIKFDLSIGMFIFTMIFILMGFGSDFIKSISKQLALCAFVEITLITLQAIRGVPSHFNYNTIFDSIVFVSMGIFIFYNTYLLVVVFVKSLNEPPRRSFVELRSVQYGLIITVLGSFIGGIMSWALKHSVGVPDGGPGLPFLGWSTVAGDLRVAHFWGIHGIQIMLIVGFLTKALKMTESRAKMTVFAAFLTSLFGVAFFLLQALYQIPFVS